MDKIAICLQKVNFFVRNTSALIVVVYFSSKRFRHIPASESLHLNLRKDQDACFPSSNL